MPQLQKSSYAYAISDACSCFWIMAASRSPVPNRMYMRSCAPSVHIPKLFRGPGQLYCGTGCSALPESFFHFRVARSRAISRLQPSAELSEAPPNI